MKDRSDRLDLLVAGMLIFVAGYLVCVPAFAAQQPAIQGHGDFIVIDKGNAAPGQYVVVITVNNDGTHSVGPLSVDYTLDGIDPPQPPDPPTPEDLTEREKEILQAASNVVDPNRDENAQKLVALHREIAKKVGSGDLTGQQNIAYVVKKSREMLLSPTQQAAWQPVFDVVGTHWDKMVQDGEADAAYLTYLSEIADGIEASTDKQNIDPAIIRLIIQIITIVLEMIKDNAAAVGVLVAPLDGVANLSRLEIAA